MVKPQHVFIAGTDTGVGKTLIAAALLRAWRAQNQTVSGFKPIAAGCEQGQNSDALLLQHESSLTLPYSVVNPYAFSPAIAPHIAAAHAQCEIDLPVILTAFEAHKHAGTYVVVEGAGGWLVPINATQTLENIAIALQTPVILVVGIRLGCLNHALLTAAAIRAAGVPIVGWVANHLAIDMPVSVENVVALQKWLEVPLLAEIPFLAGQNTTQKVALIAEKFH